jgi:S1-C subfamily serine protease
MSKAARAEKVFIYRNAQSRPLIASISEVFTYPGAKESSPHKDMRTALMWQHDAELNVSAGALYSPQSSWDLAIKSDFVPQLKKFFQSPAVVVSYTEQDAKTLAKAFFTASTPSAAVPTSEVLKESSASGVILAGLGLLLLYQIFRKS